ncbi:methyltransferase FkbM [Legionella antarctica]|uniref:Methyltransferase FkbM n=1 Tax=Legionella antarctica TaxID=2708020 RepID=A0A6F8T442_9GAMM|nr:FkbM family methyltransferase [Legionella antarctica]BCA94927.1 methyltransferase FkbM [Legionella antarctica]
MQINKQLVATYLFPMVNRMLSPLRLKLQPKSSPNRSFSEFISHLKRINFHVQTVIDVGIAFGTPAFYKSLPEAKFYLIEPVPQCKPLLEKLEHTIGATCFNVAAGSKDGEIKFFVHPDISGSSSLRQWEGEVFDGESVTVPLKKLDSLIPKSINRPSLLKIDTQGNELDVLAGAKELLEVVDVVIIETSFHEFRKGAPEIHEIISTMADLGYRCYEILEGHYRAIDNALAQVDIAFVKQDSTLRSSKCFFSEQQLSKYIAKSR